MAAVDASAASDEPRWLNDDEQRAWRAFIDAIRLFTSEIERELQHDSGLNHAYYQILVTLSETPGRTIRMSDLAELTLTSRSRLSHAVARLEDAGWVERLSCPSDKRGSFASLTDTGMAVLEDAARGHVEAVRRNLFDVLTPCQVQQLGQISSVLRDALRAGSATRCREAAEAQDVEAGAAAAAAPAPAAPVHAPAPDFATS
jgi:DNA-binding MarR family transcriptional regulator